jgi:SAM-dependent methyltransferase
MQWFEDDQFWQTFYPRMFREDRLQAAAEEVDRVLALSGVQPSASGVEQRTVLDLCCGPARHSLILAQKGFRVTGVDRSPFLLSKARERTAGVDVEFVNADMRSFVREATFDLAISLFTSFGYFETREEDLAVLRNVRASLRTGGVFILDVLGRECVAALPSRTRWDESVDGDIFIEHAEVLPGWTRLRNVWLIVKTDRTLRFEFKLNVYSGQELRAALEQAGFTDVQIFGSMAGTPYDGAATRLVARARVESATP